MKIRHYKGSVMAIAESLGDIKTLLSLEGTTRTHRKHKKHNFKKACYKCGKEFKGKAGLAIHMVKSHKDK